MTIIKRGKPGKAYKIKTPSPKVAHISQKPSEAFISYCDRIEPCTTPEGADKDLKCRDCAIRWMDKHIRKVRITIEEI